MKNIVLLLFAFLFTGPAFAGDCFFTNSVTDFSVPEDTENTMIVRAGFQYELKLNFCTQQNLKSAHYVWFSSFDGNTVCEGDDLIFREFGGTWDHTCNIDSITRIPVSN